MKKRSIGTANILIVIILVVVIGTAGFTYFTNKSEQKNDDYEKTMIENMVSATITDTTESEPRYISPINIEYMRSLNIDSEAPVIEEELSPGSNYKRYVVSYSSEGYKIYGLLTVPDSEPPEGGFSAIVFNHGYIPPDDYVTTERYVPYVDSLARNGFVVFKIDMRGHGNSEGDPTGSYFSSAYTIDAISALKSLQKLDYVNPEKIGMWGHSMSGNLLLRAMLVSDEVKAGVIWAGAVYSYEDFGKYRISDSSYRGRPRTERPESPNRENSEFIQKLREDIESLDFSNDFWSSISLTQNIEYLKNPVQIHHAENDSTVNIGYSEDLAKVLEENNKEYEFYEYSSGGHNIEGASFNSAMQRTVDFFKENL